ncbi:Uncharacterised protein [Bordetella pertussis]|uniref:Membrane protein n=8 Tax=Bordetella pertussis TaxID=520 RepID=Q7VYT4_BORPE|nr:membrane protein [Bordetella pertussis]ETH40009.1 hypothetical protein L547_2509 [Bordetella pertussis H918]ETH42355.1 hypothetical protein L549_2685 [Bordetella pertussis H939]ETH47927.1 hypothetical protein L548_2850 [Bordetella pertussis H921]ETH70890.1 hypothetical protein L545_2587 [Bordetella pertussis STO1-CHLA-0011]ETH82863.1 hypothetical protein L559_2585 [Bordetella pertussis STO1-CHOC-0017]ETH86950.1 hypothetical protein L560_2691 [Bordetella pertussis STO1-CHOC-0018]ETH89289.1
MNPHLPPDDDDRDLRALYRELPRHEPDIMLDASIREQAQRAAEADRRARRPRATWHPAWAVAACVVAVSALFVFTDLEQYALQPAAEVELQAEQEAAQATRDAVPEPPAPDPALAAPPPLGALAPEAARGAAAESSAQDAAPARRGYMPQRAAPAVRAEKQQQENLAASARQRDDPAYAQRVERIRALVREGKPQEAAAEVLAWRRAAPGLALPPDLEQLAPADGGTPGQ